MVFRFIVRGDRIEPEKDYRFIEGNKGSYEAVFDFGEEWEELGKLCVVRCGDKKYTTLITADSCLLPELVKNSAKIGVVGCASLDGAELTTRISTNMLPIGVESGAYDSEKAEELKTAAEVWEQYLSEMESSRRAAETASEVAEKAAEAAETARQGASSSETTAKTYAGNAETAAIKAETDAKTASGAAVAANTAKDAAEKSAADAENAKKELESAESSATKAADTAEKAKEAAAEASANAHASANNAATSEKNAKASEEAAEKIKTDTAELTSRAETAAENAEESEVKSSASEKSAQQALSDLLAMINSGDIILATGGKLPLSAIPATATQEIYTVSSEDELTSLTAQRGDLAELIELVNGEKTITKTWQCLGDASVRENWVVWGTSYAVQAGNSTTANNALNANTINNHRIVEMTEEDFASAVKDADTYYLVY